MHVIKEFHESHLKIRDVICVKEVFTDLGRIPCHIPAEGLLGITYMDQLRECPEADDAPLAAEAVDLVTVESIDGLLEHG